MSELQLRISILPCILCAPCTLLTWRSAPRRLAVRQTMSTSPGHTARKLRVSTSTSRRVSFSGGDEPGRTPWGYLQKGALLNVLQLLDSTDVAAACCVCKHWQEVGRAQSLWRELLEREYR